MRKIYMLLLMIALCAGWLLPVKVQAAQQPVLYMAENGLTGEVSYYYYDEQGTVIQRTNNIGHRETYIYYSDGMLKATLKYSQNKPSQFTRFDTFGNVQLVKTWLGDDTIRFQQYSNSYDEQGRLLEVLYTDSVDDELQGMSTLIYAYYEDSTAYATEFHEYHSETDESPYHTCYAYYDDEGRLLGEEDYYLDGSADNTILTNMYDEKGNLTYVNRMSYSESGHETRETTYTNKFNAAGLLVQRDEITVISSESYPNGDSRSSTQKILCKYQYDKADRMTRIDYYDESGEDMGFEVWTYDHYGNLLERNFTGRLLEAYEYAPLKEALWKNQE